MNIIIHIVGYMCIAMVVTRMVGYSLPKSFFLTLTLAILDESAQACCMANRTGEFKDIFVDMGGWSLGYIIATEISVWWGENYKI